MGTGKQYGDRIRYVCSAGYRLMGDDESICKADGSWSSSVPYCQGKIFKYLSFSEHISKKNYVY